MRRESSVLTLVVLLCLVAGAFFITVRSPAAKETITVYKDPNCDCCTKWVDHLKVNGFNVTVKEEADMSAAKKKLGVPDDLQSCHTGTVGDYVIEGHVPADDIKKLLADKQKAKGLAVPGMPAGSPGMEVGDHKDPYEVILFTTEGQKTTFAKY